MLARTTVFRNVSYSCDMSDMLGELRVTVTGNMWVELLLIGMWADVNIDVLIKMLTGVGIGVFVDVKVVVLNCVLIELEILPLPNIVELVSDDWVGAVIAIDVSLDRRVGKLIGALARV